LIGTAFFAYSTSLVAKACRITGDAAADKYQQLFEQIKRLSTSAMSVPTAISRTARSADYCMALRFNLLPDDLRPRRLNTSRKMSRLITII
jgi:alpha-L-rhamnosidase